MNKKQMVTCLMNRGKHQTLGGGDPQTSKTQLSCLSELCSRTSMLLS